MYGFGKNKNQGAIKINAIQGLSVGLVGLVGLVRRTSEFLLVLNGCPRSFIGYEEQ